MIKPIPEVSRFWGDDADRFGALLKSDRRQSLPERWKRLSEKRPDLAATDFAYMPNVVEGQWAVIAVPEDGVIYTIGLVYHFDHPELLIHAPKLLKNEALIPGFKAVLNQLGARVRDGERIAGGQRVTVGGIEFDFSEHGDEDFNEAPCGYLGGFGELFLDVFSETGSPLPVLWSTSRTATEAAPPKQKAKTKAKAKKPKAKKALPRKAKARKTKPTKRRARK
jgi:hypothetical protein